MRGCLHRVKVCSIVTGTVDPPEDSKAVLVESRTGTRTVQKVSRHANP